MSQFLGIRHNNHRVNRKSGADLILDSSGSDTITADESGDCIVAGGGDDSIDGDDGFDVCLTGSSTDVTHACETIQ